MSWLLCNIRKVFNTPLLIVRGQTEWDTYYCTDQAYITNKKNARLWNIKWVITDTLHDTNIVKMMWQTCSRKERVASHMFFSTASED